MSVGVVVAVAFTLAVSIFAVIVAVIAGVTTASDLDRDEN